MSLGYVAGPDPEALGALMAAYVGEETDTGFDDLFDDGVFRSAQASFRGQGHRLVPRGQTSFRGSVEHGAQGLPADRSSAHQSWVYDSRALPGGATPQARARAARRLAFAVAQDSSRGESPGWRAPDPLYRPPPAAGGAPYGWRA